MTWHDSKLTEEAEQKWKTKNEKREATTECRKPKPKKRAPRSQFPTWPHPDSSRAIIGAALREAGVNGLQCGEIYKALDRGVLIARQALTTMVTKGDILSKGDRGRNHSNGQRTYVWWGLVRETKPTDEKKSKKTIPSQNK